jgi:hypothetical protein
MLPRRYAQLDQVIRNGMEHLEVESLNNLLVEYLFNNILVDDISSFYKPFIIDNLSQLFKRFYFIL